MTKYFSAIFAILFTFAFGLYLLIDAPELRKKQTDTEKFLQFCKTNDTIVVFVEAALKSKDLTKDEEYRNILRKCIEVHKKPKKKDSWQKQLNVGV